MVVVKMQISAIKFYNIKIVMLLNVLWLPGYNSWRYCYRRINWMWWHYNIITWDWYSCDGEPSTRYWSPNIFLTTVFKVGASDYVSDPDFDTYILFEVKLHVSTHTLITLV